MSWFKLAEDGITLNEVGSLSPYQLFDAGTPNSRLSFGRSQFDVGQRPDAFKRVGFTDGEVATLKSIRLKAATAGQRAFLAKANQKLQQAKQVVDALDSEQTMGLLRAVKAHLGGFNGKIASPSVIAHMMDIKNQFGLCPLLWKIAGNDNIITQQEILSWRLGTLHGRNYPGDMKRRHANIEGKFKGILITLPVQEMLAKFEEK